MASRLTSLVLVAALAAAPLPVFAGPMERACNKSERRASNRSLCNCIQQVADFKLSNKDQRLAASFFKDPHKAQAIRQSDSRSHEAFWQRYKDFASVAGASCRAAS
jgi:hypothetical protein